MGEQSNLAKILDKMKKNMDAEEAERVKLKEKRAANQKVLVKEGSRQSEKVSSHRDRHRSSENSIKSALKQNKDKHEGAGRVEVKCLKSKDLQQKDMKKEKASNRRVEDAEVTESRKRLEAKLNTKRREANGETGLHGQNLDNQRSQSQLNTSSNSGNGLIKSQDQGKKKVAEEFVICLTPFLKTGRIVNKETFKILARNLTHMTVQTGVEMSRARVQAIVADFFDTNNTEPVRRETVKELVTAFHIKL